MNLIYNILPTYLLLDVWVSSMSNFDIPHGGYLHHLDMMQRDNNYQHYDSYSSQEVVMRQATRRSRKSYPHHFEYSDTEYNYKCKCSCTKCKKWKSKQKPCCEDFCATECAVQNNILVVPYPVPFMIFNQSATEFPMPPPTTQSSSTTTTTSEPTTTTTTPEPTTTTTTTPESTTRITFPVSQSTVPYYDSNSYKRFRIISDNNMRRNNLAKNMLRSPKFGRLPKYGIVPIPENLALSLMQQIKKDQNNDQLRKRLALDKNLLDYTRRAIA